MDNRAPIKSVILTAHLKNNSVKYQLCPVNEFSEGVWNIAIQSIAYSCVDNFQEHCQISCNLSKAQRINKTFEVESYEQPFGLFLLQKGQHVIYFGEKM